MFYLLRSAVSLWAAGSTQIKDSESASHGAEDAFHQIVETHRFPGFEIVQFTLPVLSHYSYLLVSSAEGVLVDPDRDIDAYLDYAKKNNLSIKGVFLTHSHADFVAGHLETVRALKVPIYRNTASGAQYAIEPLEEGSTFRVGKAVATAIETPGHTPDGMCGLVSAEGETEPRTVFTGDTLFVGSIGRPDLLEGTMTAATLASISFDTWHNKLSRLPDTAVVLPAHGPVRCAARTCRTTPPRPSVAKGRPILTFGGRAAASSSRRCWRGCQTRRSTSSTMRP